MPPRSNGHGSRMGSFFCTRRKRVRPFGCRYHPRFSARSSKCRTTTIGIFSGQATATLRQRSQTGNGAFVDSLRESRIEGHFHMLRDTAAVGWLTKGVPLETVSILLGQPRQGMRAKRDLIQGPTARTGPHISVLHARVFYGPRQQGAHRRILTPTLGISGKCQRSTNTSRRHGLETSTAGRSV